MTSPRLKLETGARDEDVRDDSPKGGFFHRAERTHDRHHLHKTWFVSRWDASIQDGTKARDQNAFYHQEHEKEHGRHSDFEEWLADKLETAEARIAKLEAQHELIAKSFGHALAPLVDVDDASG